MLTDLLKEKLYKQGYQFVQEIPGHGVCAVMTYLLTTAIVCQLDETHYGYRYCFEQRQDAIRAILDWRDEPHLPHPPGPWIKRKGINGDMINKHWCKAANDE